MSSRTWAWPVVIVLSSVVVAIFGFGASTSPVRAAVALWFLFVCPGMALVRLLRLGEFLTELTLAVALSLALDALVAGTLLYAGLWSPQWALIVLISVSVVGAALQIVLTVPIARRVWRSLGETMSAALASLARQSASLRRRLVGSVRGHRVRGAPVKSRDTS